MTTKLVDFHKNCLTLNSQNADLMATVILIVAMIMGVFALVGRIEAWATAWKRPA